MKSFRFNVRSYDHLLLSYLQASFGSVVRKEGPVPAIIYVVQRLRIFEPQLSQRWSRVRDSPESHSAIVEQTFDLTAASNGFHIFCVSYGCSPNDFFGPESENEAYNQKNE